MPNTRIFSAATLPQDIIAGIVVFLVALPLCLGVAMASNAPIFAGLVAGIVGGLLVGCLSGSHTSVSGPSAGSTAVVVAQIAALGSFEAFLAAVVVGGLIQVGLGMARAGFIAAFVPSSVIKGLLAAIGVILILKQIPHVLGIDRDPEGDFSFRQPDHENTFSEFANLPFEFHVGAAVIGLVSILILIAWDNIKPLRKSIVPAPLVVVLLGVLMNWMFQRLTPDPAWNVGGQHLVQVPIAENLGAFLGLFTLPDFSQFLNRNVYVAGLTIALVASLETLLNLEAIDKIDPKQRVSPPSRELIAQGVGNIAAGFLGGIPVTSVVVRSSVNVHAGGQTKLAAVVHGFLLLACVAAVPSYLNMIPLASLAAILLVTGFKLISPTVIKEMWKQGRYQFAPFIVTVVAIVLTDLLIGTLIGLAVSVSFILNSNLRRPIRRFNEKHLGGDVLHIQLANQVSFLNRAALLHVLDSLPRGGQVLLDADATDYIDPDVLALIRDFTERTAPARGVKVSLRGFRDKYQLKDRIQYVDFSTRELQAAIAPAQVLDILKAGHERFRNGQRLTRDLSRQVKATADGQHPLAAVLSCMDSRTPAELLFDMGVGDIFSVRIAGNIVSRKVLGSLEYACAVANAKLILVKGHTRCGAVTAAVRAACSNESMAVATGCGHIEHVLQEIEEVVDHERCRRFDDWTAAEQQAFVDGVVRANVRRTMQKILEQSQTLRDLTAAGKVAVVGAVYDVATGNLSFLADDITTAEAWRMTADV